MEIVFVGDHKEPLHDCPYHRHDAWELVLYRGGVGENWIEGEAYAFCPGCVFLIPPGFCHRSLGNGVFTDRYIHIRGLSWPVTDRPTRFFDDERRLETLAWYLFAEFHGSSPNRAATVYALWEAIHQILIGKQQKERTLPPEVEAFQTLLLHHLSDPDFDLQAAVAQTPYCEDHFRRIFRRYTGATPAAYLSDLRISYAKRLLRHEYPSHMKIADVALASGFRDPYYFARLFKKRTGLSPSGYHSAPEARSEFSITE